MQSAVSSLNDHAVVRRNEAEALGRINGHGQWCERERAAVGRNGHRQRKLQRGGVGSYCRSQRPGQAGYFQPAEVNCAAAQSLAEIKLEGSTQTWLPKDTAAERDIPELRVGGDAHCLQLQVHAGEPAIDLHLTAADLATETGAVIQIHEQVKVELKSAVCTFSELHIRSCNRQLARQVKAGLNLHVHIATGKNCIHIDADIPFAAVVKRAQQ